jgi:hypothetical protein
MLVLNIFPGEIFVIVGGSVAKKHHIALIGIEQPYSAA